MNAKDRNILVAWALSMASIGSLPSAMSESANVSSAPTSAESRSPKKKHRLWLWRHSRQNSSKASFGSSKLEGRNKDGAIAPDGSQSAKTPIPSTNAPEITVKKQDSVPQLPSSIRAGVDAGAFDAPQRF